MTSRNEQNETSYGDLGHLLSQIEKKISDLSEVTKQQKILLQLMSEIKDRIDNIESGIHSGFGHTKKQLKTIDSQTSQNFQEIKGELPKLVNQQIQLSKFLEEGEMPLSFEGWTIAPDLAFRLVNDYSQYKFDGIVEFGSGLSTCLLAKLSISNGCKLFSFEHDKTYLDKTATLLKSLKLESEVNLIHGKLKNLCYESLNYKFYTCLANLKKMAKSLSAGSRVLILVDGPPGRTNIKARFPALPLVLECFPDSIIHIYLDDYNRLHEQEIIADWESILIKENIKFEKEVIDLKKGLCILKIFRNEKQGIENDSL
ncbi:hypothetical protein BM523_16090 [Alteromonas mediterranea]|uniref:class I SAM-dependent methyltransferase n=1 Tax=Alteromonas mediterranea TaxID=314275 RepID=UPI000903106B|nr:class I SAM-dependent methyltransferase [Alteromonas mediterranea]APD95389.1 hypothetical protein BM523_16090 [Alteromonas mediterranea]APD99023.1 hypothetical protein BM525_16110 [Alteromonas mediterranea]